MSVTGMTAVILKELKDNLRLVEDEPLEHLVEELLQAKHIFTAGAGRSGVAVRAFTNRLMHLGLSVSNVGEISAPHTRPGDLLLISSGSGQTESLVAMAKKAKACQVRIALITMDADSAIGRMADVVAVLPGASPKLQNAKSVVTSIQPMGSAFEQMSFLVYDGIVLELMKRTGQTSETMFLRHADLE